MDSVAHETDLSLRVWTMLTILSLCMLSILALRLLSVRLVLRRIALVVGSVTRLLLVCAVVAVTVALAVALTLTVIILTGHFALQYTKC